MVYDLWHTQDDIFGGMGSRVVAQQVSSPQVHCMKSVPDGLSRDPVTICLFKVPTFCILKGLNIHLLFLYKIICIYKKDIWDYTLDPLMFLWSVVN